MSFIGHALSECGEHRTTGPRAWCLECRQWCYPEIPCAGCRLGLVETRIRKVREICSRAIEVDEQHMTDRVWLAVSVNNILDGKIDDQLKGDV